LDTVGGALERFARDRSPAAVGLATYVVAAKVVAGFLAIKVTLSRSRRFATLAAGIGTLLALYGAVLTAAGAFALTGVFGSLTPEGQRALLWHVVLWDPWFLVWGVALAVSGVTVRRL
jgi:hypothetical protein